MGIRFDRSWHEHNLRVYVAPFLSQYRVPLFINQFAVVHGVSDTNGRYQYVEDLLYLAREFNLSWTWWTWAGGSPDGWSHGSSEIVFHWPNGTISVDEHVLAAMRPYFSTT